MKKKIISIALSIAVCFAFTPMFAANQAHAANATVTDAKGLAAALGTSNCTVSGNTVKLKSNVTYNGILYFTNANSNSVITLDLNGHELNSMGSYSRLFDYSSKGTLNVIDSSNNKSSSKVKCEGQNYSAFYISGGTINMKGITVYTTGGCGAYVKNSTLNISNCNFTGGGMDDTDNAIHATNLATLTIGGKSNIEGRHAVYIESLNVKTTLKSCSLINTSGTSSTSYWSIKCSGSAYYDNAAYLKATIHKDYYSTPSLANITNGIYTPNLTVSPKPGKVYLSKTTFAYNGKVQTPDGLTVKDADGGKVDDKYINYTVLQQLKAAATSKNVGTYTLPVTFNSPFNAITLYASYKIVPKKAAVKSIKIGKKCMTVTASSKPAATGGTAYKVSYKMTSAKKWATKATKSQSLKIKGLKKGKKYQVKICAYKGSYAGAYSSVKTSKKIK